MKYVTTFSALGIFKNEIPFYEFMKRFCKTFTIIFQNVKRIIKDFIFCPFLQFFFVPRQ